MSLSLLSLLLLAHHSAPDIGEREREGEREGWAIESSEGKLIMGNIGHGKRTEQNRKGGKDGRKEGGGRGVIAASLRTEERADELAICSDKSLRLLNYLSIPAFIIRPWTSQDLVYTAKFSCPSFDF